MKVSVVLLALVSALTIGCREEPASSVTTQTSTTAATASASSPEELGRLGAEIQKNPSEAGRLLSAAGHTEASFASAIREVTENQESSRRYTAAFRETEARRAP